MISDHPAQQGKALRKQRSLSAEGKWWSDSQKLECVQTWMMTGNVAMTARILKIPEPTVRIWSKTTWWGELVEDFKTQDRLSMSTRLKKLVDKSLDAVEDRLEKGDFVYDQKTGAMRRKPVAMRDAHKVALDLDNKRDLLLRDQRPSVSVDAIDDKLNKLAEKFAALVNGRKPPSEEIIDVQAREMEQPDGHSDEMEAYDEPEGLEDLGGEEQPRTS